MEKYDVDSLTDLIDVQSVIDTLGIEYNWKGSRLFIRCPEHMKNTGKLEHNIDNCVLTNRGYHCYSCHANGSVYSLVQITQNVTFQQAVEIVANISGVNIGQIKSDEEDFFLPVTKEDLEILGLVGTVSAENPKESRPFNEKRKNTLIENMSVPELNAQYGCYMPSYVYGSISKYSLMELYKENKDAFIEMIIGKIKEKLVDNCAIIDSQILKTIFHDQNTAYNVECGIRKNIERLNILAQKFGVEQQHPVTAKRIRSRFKTNSL